MDLLEYAHLCKRSYHPRHSRRDRIVRSRSHVSLVRPRDHHVIVCTRGSRDWDHVWTNADVRTVSCGDDLRFHRGFWKAAHHLWDPLHLSWYDDAIPITFTGHSMGGAISVALACLMHAARPNRPVRVVTFGSPCYGRGTWLDPFPIENYLLRNDLVTSLPRHLHRFGSNRWIESDALPSPHQPYGIVRYHTIENYIRSIRRSSNARAKDSVPL